MVPTQPNPVPSTSNGTSIQELIRNNYNNTPQSVTIKNTEDVDCSIDCNSVVLNSTLAPAVIQYTDIEPSEQASEDTKLLPNKEKISVEAVVVKQLTSQGADFGLKWFHLVCFMLVIGVAIPIIYILFYLDKPELEHPDIPPLHNTS